MTTQAAQEESASSVESSLFSNTAATTNHEKEEDEEQMMSFAEQFKDKVKIIHEHFDKNQDGYLNFEELSNLQLCTSGQSLDGTVYAYICQAFGCHPDKGLSLDGLKLTYASEGTDLGACARTVFSSYHMLLRHLQSYNS